MKRLSMITLLAGLAMVVLLPQAAWGQDQDCKAEVRAILRKLNAPQENNGATIKLQMTMTVAPKDSHALGKSQQVVTMVCGGGKLLYESAELRVYADADLTMNVVPAEKTLYLSPGLSQRAPTPRGVNFAAVDSSLLAGAEVVACKRLGKSGGAVKKVLEITKGKGSLERYGLKTVRYVYDPVASRILEVRLSYVPSSEIAYVQVRYDVLDMDYRGPILGSSVRQMFFSSGETLHSKYTGYKLIKTNKQL